jgi:hypothetical protein
MNASPSLLLKPMIEPVAPEIHSLCSPPGHRIEGEPGHPPSGSQSCHAGGSSDRCSRSHGRWLLPMAALLSARGRHLHIVLPRCQGICATDSTPVFSVATFRYQPPGWENQARFLAPDAHVVELQRLGAQAHFDIARAFGQVNWAMAMHKNWPRQEKDLTLCSPQ